MGLAIVLATLGGCTLGDGEDEEGRSAPVTTSKEEFIARADAICAKYLKEEQPLRDQLPRDDSPEAFRQVADLLPQLATSLRSQLDELRRLDSPADIRERWKATLDLIALSADKLDEGAAAAGRFDRAAFARVAAEAVEIEHQTAAFASEYGFNVCGSRAAQPDISSD